jgi:hypothetical protein
VDVGDDKMSGIDVGLIAGHFGFAVKEMEVADLRDPTGEAVEPWESVRNRFYTRIQRLDSTGRSSRTDAGDFWALVGALSNLLRGGELRNDLEVTANVAACRGVALAAKVTASSYYDPKTWREKGLDRSDKDTTVEELIEILNNIVESTEPARRDYSGQGLVVLRISTSKKKLKSVMEEIHAALDSVASGKKMAISRQSISG